MKHSRPPVTYRDLKAWLSLLKEDQLDQPVTMLVEGEVKECQRLRIYETDPDQPYMDFDSNQDKEV